MQIPPVIFSTWKSKTNLGNFTSYVDSVKKCNPSFEYIIYDDADCDHFVQTCYPQYYKYYIKLELPVQKADLWRYLVIYYYGGWYCDMDIYAYSSFNSIKISRKDENENSDLMIVEQEFQAPFKYRNTQYAQYWFAATPRHPILLKIIHQVVQNIRDMDMKPRDDDFTLNLTGPFPFTDMILLHAKNNVQVIEPNISDVLSQPLYSISSLFADWKNIPVVHKCEGSWRTSDNNYLIFFIFTIFIMFIIIYLYIFQKS